GPRSRAPTVVEAFRRHRGSCSRRALPAARRRSDASRSPISRLHLLEAGFSCLPLAQGVSLEPGVFHELRRRGHALPVFSIARARVFLNGLTLWTNSFRRGRLSWRLRATFVSAQNDFRSGRLSFWTTFGKA